MVVTILTMLLRDMPLLNQGYEPGISIDKQLGEGVFAEAVLTKLDDGQFTDSERQLMHWESVQSAPLDHLKWLRFAVFSYNTKQYVEARHALTMALRIAPYDLSTGETRLLLIGGLGFGLKPDDRAWALRYTKWFAENRSVYFSKAMANNVMLNRFVRANLPLQDIKNLLQNAN